MRSNCRDLGTYASPEVDATSEEKAKELSTTDKKEDGSLDSLPF